MITAPMHNVRRLSVILFFFFVLMGACDRNEKHPEKIEIIPLLERSEQERAKQVFGKVYMEVSYKDYADTNFPKLIEKMVVYSQKGEKRTTIAEITKNGFLRNGTIDISPAGFDKDSQFVKDHFIGFSLESLDDPFVLYGVAKDTSGHVYETDPLIIWVLDYENQSTKLYVPEY